MRVFHQNESCLYCLHPPSSYDGRREQGAALILMKNSQFDWTLRYEEAWVYCSYLQLTSGLCRGTVPPVAGVPSMPSSPSSPWVHLWGPRQGFQTSSSLCGRWSLGTRPSALAWPWPSVQPLPFFRGPSYSESYSTRLAPYGTANADR